jgi:hypothetical protein
MLDAEVTVARVSHLAGEEVEVAAGTTEAVAAEPEVIKKGKIEEEEAEE